MSEIKKSPEEILKKKTPGEKTSDQTAQDVEDVTKVAQNGAMAVIEDNGDSLANADAEIRRVKKGDKFIFVDKDGNNILKGEMTDGVDEARSFWGDRAIVKLGNKYFYIDKEGHNILKGEMADGVDEAHSFINGIARVEFNGKSYYLNKNGDLITEEEYESISCFGVEV